MAACYWRAEGSALIEADHAIQSAVSVLDTDYPRHLNALQICFIPLWREVMKSCLLSVFGMARVVTVPAARKTWSKAPKPALAAFTASIHWNYSGFEQKHDCRI